MKKLYVGNLPYSVGDNELREIFAKNGDVGSAVVIMDNMSRPPRSKGFGFVEFANDSEADAAIDMYNNKEVSGRTLVVNEARPKVDRYYHLAKPPHSNGAVLLYFGS